MNPLLSLPFLSPSGRDGKRTAAGGAYVIDHDPRRGKAWRVTHRDGGNGTLCDSLGETLDAVIAHLASESWDLGCLQCPAMGGYAERCVLLRRDHATISPATAYLPAQVTHKSGRGREWAGSAA